MISYCGGVFYWFHIGLYMICIYGTLNRNVDQLVASACLLNISS